MADNEALLLKRRDLRRKQGSARKLLHPGKPELKSVAQGFGARSSYPPAGDINKPASCKTHL
jgi:hypothetical protein